EARFCTNPLGAGGEHLSGVASSQNGGCLMIKVLRMALAGACLMLTAACASMVTGGPLIRDGEPVGAIEVGNASGAPVNVVLISACSASTYGLNRLPSGTYIPPGSTYRFTVSAGCWDVGAGSTAAMVHGYQRIQVSPNRVTPAYFQ